MKKIDPLYTKKKFIYKEKTPDIFQGFFSIEPDAGFLFLFIPSSYLSDHFTRFGHVVISQSMQFLFKFL